MVSKLPLKDTQETITIIHAEFNKKHWILVGLKQYMTIKLIKTLIKLTKCPNP